MLNLNNVPSDDNNREFELIPDGTIVRAFIKLEGGSTELPEYGAGRFFDVAQQTDAKWLPIELTIVGGNFDKRKIWHKIFVDGTKISEKTGMPIAKEIGLRTMKAIIDSAFNLDPKDQSEESQQKRNLQGVNQLNGMEFCFKVGIEKGTNGYEDKNKIKVVLTPDMNGFIAGSTTQSVPASAPPMQQPVATQAAPQQTATAGVVPSWANNQGGTQ
jgi:hypothetical protein|tara:strand:+ start:14248 stop:14892 length:645 start_codon:yes stop_codon:yes gene_type:complete